ncbi:MAG: hypothetical protein IPL19_18685 [Sandaracinaceae bacterium]|nr:hypothetical protein [Sandaracinaceae bacterium]
MAASWRRRWAIEIPDESPERVSLHHMKFWSQLAACPRDALVLALGQLARACWTRSRRVRARRRPTTFAAVTTPAHRSAHRRSASTRTCWPTGACAATCARAPAPCGSGQAGFCFVREGLRR